MVGFVLCGFDVLKTVAVEAAEEKEMDGQRMGERGFIHSSPLCYVLLSTS